MCPKKDCDIKNVFENIKLKSTVLQLPVMSTTSYLEPDLDVDLLL